MSSKRQHDLQLIQQAVAVSEKILKLSTTRWLSRYNVIECLLEQWDALHIFFQSEIKTDKENKVIELFTTMNTEYSD